MSTDTSISWATKTWSPILGCERVSSGCEGCYAIRTVHRLAHNPSPKVGPLYAGLTEYRDGRLDWTGRVAVLHGRLKDPLAWRKPQRVFVNSQADLFHKDVPRYFTVRILAVMAMAPQHTFLVLTKRHARMKALLSEEALRAEVRAEQCRMAADAGESEPLPLIWPLRNLHLGVSVEDQHWADVRIPALLDTPAAVRWISAEPLLGPIDLRHVGTGAQSLPKWDVLDSIPHLDGVVVGGESGPNARPMHPEWVRSIHDQCAAAGIPFHLKQLGEWAPAEWKGPNGATHAFTGGIYQDDRGAWVENFMEIGHIPTSSERNDTTPAGAQGMRRVGRKAAGHELDGVTINEFPGTAA